jgi:hypothetical protein
MGHLAKFVLKSGDLLCSGVGGGSGCGSGCGGCGCGGGGHDAKFVLEPGDGGGSGIGCGSGGGGCGGGGGGGDGCVVGSGGGGSGDRFTWVVGAHRTNRVQHVVSTHELPRYHLGEKSFGLLLPPFLNFLGGVLRRF